MNQSKSSFLLFSAVLLSMCGPVPFAHTVSSGEWYGGTGTATGKDMVRIRIDALNNARADALQKAGVQINAATFSLKSEGDGRLVDFFSEFAEATSTGLITDERNVHFDTPVPLDSTYTIYRVTAHLEALIASPQGKSDPAFSVTLSSARDTYKEDEPVTLTINTTQSGYLTLLDIHGDSVTVLFPNQIDTKNFVAANQILTFPPSKAYSLELETETGQPNSTDILIAVVTKDDIPFPNIHKVGTEGSELLVAERSLMTYAKWLYKFPLDRRSAASKAIRVEKVAG